jgi:tRNA(Ile)-lysidine synthase
VTLLEPAADFIRRHAMLAGGETVLVAVSGGADSVALLHVMLGLVPRLRLRLHVLHVDHGLRAESGEDADFVTALAGGLGIPVTVERARVRPGASLEAAAREARYAALERAADRIGADRIAVGHTLDDQAETVLMRVLEGAGVRGLAGIPPVRGRVIRPLLAVRRHLIEAEVRALGIEWRDDPSNRDRKHLRNRIRHDVLPMLTATLDPGVVPALGRVARTARETIEALEHAASVELERLAVPAEGALVFSRSALAGLPEPLAIEVLRQAAGRLGAGLRLRAWGHRGLARLLAPVAPRPFPLGGVTFEASGDRVRVAAHALPSFASCVLDLPGRVELPEIGRTLVATVRPSDNLDFDRDPDHAAFDADQLPARLLVRPRQAGDRLTPFGGARPRRLKTMLIDAGVPRWDRERLPVVEAAGAIVWVAGLRRSAMAPVGATTRRVLELGLHRV